MYLPIKLNTALFVIFVSHCRNNALDLIILSMDECT